MGGQGPGQETQGYVLPPSCVWLWWGSGVEVEGGPLPVPQQRETEIGKDEGTACVSVCVFRGRV